MQRGDRLGTYEIIELLGAGGMGEVYRARDTKLNRDVALKSLPDAVAADPDRMARFKREAQTLAAINHSNIAAIYGFEDSGATHALVMELVEGEDLAQRIARGPIGIDEALPIAKQIAEALEAAHEQDIVHRDLKPANIKVRPDGTVKVLDFGLAKALGPADAGRYAPGDGGRVRLQADLTQSPTLTSPAQMTGAGVILGTAAYMAPEQARGRAVDRRADIWAFGAVLFEMLAGIRAFPGDDVTDLIVAVMSRAPDWAALPANVPPSVARLLRRCLEKDLKRRLQAIGEARIALDDAGNEKPEDVSLPVARKTPAWKIALPWSVAAIAVATAIPLVFNARQPRGVTAPVRFTVTAPPKNAIMPPGLTISPDGRTIAFTAIGTDGRNRIWVRPLDAAASPLAGTENAFSTFWSADSRFIAFSDGVKLKKIPAGGGAVQTIADSGTASGGAWSRNGVIVFVGEGGLKRVPADGGTPVAATKAGGNYPNFLPDGKHFVFSTNKPAILVGSLDSMDATELPIRVRSRREGAPANVAAPALRYADGYLLFTDGRALMAERFDPSTLSVAGEPFAIAEDLYLDARIGASESGTIVYTSGDYANRVHLTWFDRKGEAVDTLVPAPGFDFDLSPDGTRVLSSRFDEDTQRRNIWAVDMAHRTEAPVTTELRAFAGVWSPDGSRMAFFSGRADVPGIYLRTLLTGREELLVKHSSGSPSQWTGDGKFIVYDESPPNARRRELWVLPTDGDRKPRPLLTGSFVQTHGQISPDGRRIAYESDESGRFEIYVQAFPALGDKRQLSSKGGRYARWSANGRELFYFSADGKMMSAAIESTVSGFVAAPPAPLFDVFAVQNSAFNVFSVTPDGQRFLMLTPFRADSTVNISVLANWTGTFKK